MSISTRVVPAAAFTTPPHPDRPEGWRITWGQQFDIRPVRADVRHQIGNGQITEVAVAAYLAKYSTKGTETTGHISKRLTATTVGLHNDPATHAGGADDVDEPPVDAADA